MLIILLLQVKMGMVDYRAMNQRQLKMANLSIQIKLDYINAHGTSTIDRR